MLFKRRISQKQIDKGHVLLYSFIFLNLFTLFLYCINVMNIHSEKFWLNDPKVLLSCNIIPTLKMTKTERLNAFTRLVIVIAIIMYLLNYDHYMTVLIIGLLLILLLRNTQTEGFRPRRGNHDPCHTCGFDSTLAYINTKYETTPQNQFSHVNYGLRSYTNAKYKVIPPYVPAPYSEVWRRQPRWY